MRKTRRTARLAVCAVAFAIAATATTAGPAGAADAKPVGGEVGITATQIRIAIVADVDTPLSPGVFQAQVDAMRGYARYVNKHGGVAGRKLVVDFIDSKLNPDESRDATITACGNDFAMVSRPGNDLVQLRLFADYASNPPLYPRLHAYLRDSRVPVLAVWGRNDEIFGPDGARAFLRDLPDAEVHLLDGGHFLLETAVDEVAALIRDFLARRLTPDQRNDS